jgi:5-methylcytosine-specific restriction enzyme subunit McrC
VPERATINTTEYGQVDLPSLSDNDIAVIGQAGRSSFQLARTRHGWSLEVGPVCGIVELETCHLVIAPKLMPDGATVLRWLAYARSIPTELDLRRTWSTSEAGIRDLVITALLRECAELLRGGLLRGYREHRTVDTSLSGRLDLTRQIARRYGQIDQLHLHQFRREAAIWENLLCAAALEVAVRQAQDAQLRRRARDIAALFPLGHTDRIQLRRWISTGRYHRMNDRYRSAHNWAALLLDGGGPDDVLLQGAWPAGTLLFDMNRLWELVVGRLCNEISTSPSPRRPTIVVDETGRQRRTLRPDAAVDLESMTIPIDAKYKDYAVKPISRDDTHQLLTYGAAFALPLQAQAISAIVHPAPMKSTRTVIVTAASRPLGAIVIIGLDPGGDPADAMRTMSAALPLAHCRPDYLGALSAE